jgi:hypothetical protein
VRQPPSSAGYARLMWRFSRERVSDSAASRVVEFRVGQAVALAKLRSLMFRPRRCRMTMVERWRRGTLKGTFFVGGPSDSGSRHKAKRPDVPAVSLFGVWQSLRDV